MDGNANHNSIQSHITCICPAVSLTSLQNRPIPATAHANVASWLFHLGAFGKATLDIGLDSFRLHSERLTPHDVLSVLLCSLCPSGI